MNQVPNSKNETLHRIIRFFLTGIVIGLAINTFELYTTHHHQPYWLSMIPGFLVAMALALSQFRRRAGEKISQAPDFNTLPPEQKAKRFLKMFSSTPQLLASFFKNLIIFGLFNYFFLAKSEPAGEAIWQSALFGSLMGLGFVLGHLWMKKRWSNNH